MKKLSITILATIIVMLPTNTFAINENVTVDVVLDGEIKDRNIIDIKFKWNSVENFYWTQREYKFNPT